MEIFLVRHAQTDFTRDKRYCSFTDISLNEAGVQQALNLRDKLEILPADVIFCSLYKRTQQTAQILKEGKVVANANECNKRKNPKKVKAGRKAATACCF